MKPEDFVVYVLDDDEEFLDALELQLKMEGWKTKCFSSPESFLNAYPENEHCIVLLDAKMPKLSGVDVLEIITVKNKNNPVIFLTGHGDIDLAVHVLKNGACDFIQKPVIPEKLFKAMNQAISRINDKQLQFSRVGFETLTEKEQKVLKKVRQGLNTREIAEALGMSTRTAEAHKWRAMQKLGVHKLSELLAVLSQLKESHSNQ